MTEDWYSEQLVRSWIRCCHCHWLVGSAAARYLRRNGRWNRFAVGGGEWLGQGTGVAMITRYFVEC
jgi:hypothetical protein